MNLIKLKLSMLGTVAVIIGLSTLFLALVLSLAGVDILLLPIFVVAFNIVQWLIAPYLIDALYRVRELPESELPWLHRSIEKLSIASNIKKPKVMLAQIPIPNAFAYGSPIAGTRVAVTGKLLEILEPEEVEAVIGHELGHLKHRDVQVMMIASVLPAIFYYIGYSFMLSYYYRGSYGRDRGGNGLAALIGILSIFMYYILSLLVLGLSRLREYYADRHSASVVEYGASKLASALAKLVTYTSRIPREKMENFLSFRALFITDPGRAHSDAEELKYGRSLAESIASREITWVDRLLEIFSTHPNIVKRIRALLQIES
ncbi:MAG: zinc metalloprotease HtpX [Nitrososphaerota archaeon]|nr:zinc metalloprotease HtpX [Candidatus Bathyarchaeota archaeon]MCX8161927.1 zinc metalloprotease HtpX [Candidatus Bathyarchaeota archaeon]MDW8061490.1 zinc metalloprotease HtpX [Nitrososphaerota archaeon]